ncbi:MAG: hypothetical protein H7641_02730 [Candidatus Heimdallarchaeota archaeon]|nr:hypothetical protein [Candidatus Heimdallarchaeota archaeon]MCK4876479.1 hypothetical protein [Candidatus Heimdallarchaeota archaeon]
MVSQSTESQEQTAHSTDMRPRSFGEVWKDWSLATLKFIGKKIHSPFGIYLLVTWLISILTMCITNTLRGESFFDGPRYWMEVFLTYGLNSNQNPALRFIAKPFVIWFFAPMVALFLGFTLLILVDSGFFRNGADPISEIAFNQKHRFYNVPDIWGSNVHINGSPILLNDLSPKGTQTYFWIVWIPILLGAFIAAVYNFIVFKKIKKTKYLPKASTFLVGVFVGCVIVGTSLALMTGDIELSFKDIFYSLFVERVTNKFLVYGFEYESQGQYHPVGSSFTMWLIFMIPFLIIYGFFIVIGNLDNIWKNIDFPVRKVREFIRARQAPELVFEETPEN